VRIPIQVERKLNRLIITPRMHGIHHSVVKDETNSNWSSGLTVWDWLHSTLRLNIPQDEITIGVPAYRMSDDVDLSDVLKLPFVKQRPTWMLPGNGQPVRVAAPADRNRLLP
jgi:sterol desaturase/sphingolipid hydroxylase (fatty acid hydroxylase superfamily)